MSQTKLEEHRLIKIVRELAAANPDFVYPSDGKCYYTPDKNQPGCIFGQALLKLGYSREDLLKLDNNNGLAILTALNELNIIKSLTKKEKEWCMMVQGRQDTGDTWGNTIKNTDALLKDKKWT